MLKIYRSFYDFAQSIVRFITTLPATYRLRSAAAQRAIAIVAIGVTTTAGAILLGSTHAASQSLTLEPEIGTIVGAAATGSDTSASNNNFVLFGSSFRLTGLDSTIRANWTPLTTMGIKWQIVSAWTGDGLISSGSRLVNSKILGPTATVADLNGLATGQQFTVKLQTMDNAGVVSNVASSSASTVAQRPVANTAYFDNFNDAAAGPLNSDYYDVRTWSGYGDTQDIDESKMAFVNERHFHGEVLESQGQGGVLVRARVPALLTNSDGSDRTMTFQTEVDMPALQSVHGKWFEIHFSSTPADDAAAYGSDQAAKWPNDVRFAIDNQNCVGDSEPNTASIHVNSNGNDQLYCGAKLQHFTPTNVRVPIVIKLSKTRAEVLINGRSMVTATGFSLPFSQGYWSVLDTNYRSGYDGSYLDTSPTITNTVSHWDMWQFDGPNGSYNPVAKTYLQTGCPGSVIINYHAIRRCPAIIAQRGNNGSATITIPASDDLTKLRSAKLLFNGPHTNPMALTLNGQPLVTIPGGAGNLDTEEHLNTYDLSSAQIARLRSGVNTFGFSGSIAESGNYNVISQLELETVYNAPRTIGNPPQDFMAMLGTTNNNLRYDHIAGQPNNMTGGTNFYAAGGDTVTNYTISQVNAKAAPWFSLTSPATGTISPVPAGGQILPITYNLDFSKYDQPSTTGSADSADAMGIPAVLKISGGSMPVYIAVLAVKDQITKPITQTTYTSNETFFNTLALP